MSEDPAIVLQQWATLGKLSEATLSNDGTELSFNGVTLLGTTNLSITHADKTCVYSLASIFLQIMDPEQSLVQYRKACKQHNVSDPIKTTDKPTILGFIFSESSEGGAPAPAVPAEDVPVTAAVEEPVVEAVAPVLPAVADRKARDKEKRERQRADDRRKEKDRQRSSSSSKDKHRHDKKRSHSASRSEEKKKKVPKTLNAETLFSNLITVVGKRSSSSSQKKKEETAQLMVALSTEGFEVTPEVLSKFKEKSDAIIANEIPVGNSASILKAAAGKDLSRVLKLYLEAIQPKVTKPSSSSSGNNNNKAGQPKVWRTYLLGKRPVIIVPKGMTAPITLLNSHEFFGNRRYVPREEMMKQGVHKTSIPTTFTRRVGQRLGGGIVEYEIMDNPKSKLPTAKDWDRVVAVVCLGQSWQFKDWPGHYSDPVRLFSTVFGFYCGMEGAKVPDELNAWAVTQAKLNRDKRGMDAVTYASFWNGVDEFMAINKPEMLPQLEG
jgi:parafibromin